MRYVARSRGGGLVQYYDPAAAERIPTLVGHLINPQVCGLAWSEVRRMNVRQADAVLGAVNLSNTAIAKAQKG